MKKEPEIKIGDIITFNWHGKLVQGKVIKLDPLTVI